MSSSLTPTPEEIKQIEDIGEFKITPESFVRTAPLQEGLNLEKKVPYNKSVYRMRSILHKLLS